MIAGSPGGSAIINYVAKTLIGVLDWKLDPQAAIGAAELRQPQRSDGAREGHPGGCARAAPQGHGPRDARHGAHQRPAGDRAHAQRVDRRCRPAARRNRARRLIAAAGGQRCRPPPMTSDLRTGAACGRARVVPQSPREELPALVALGAPARLRAHSGCTTATCRNFRSRSIATDPADAALGACAFTCRSWRPAGCRIAQEHAAWVDAVRGAVAAALEIPLRHIAFKHRPRRQAACSTRRPAQRARTSRCSKAACASG